jgi:hypothetical protein
MHRTNSRHQTYYGPHGRWPLMVRAGFRPHGLHCFRHKFGSATFTVCRVDPAEA